MSFSLKENMMLKTDVIVREAKPEDVEFIIEANFAVFGKNSDNLREDEKKLRKDLFGRQAKAKVIIAEVEEKVVGMALYATTYFAGQGELMWVSQMYVNPHFRNRKQWVAPALMSELIKIAQEKKLSYICWATDIENNIPKKLSQKLGAKALENFMMFALPLEK